MILPFPRVLCEEIVHFVIVCSLLSKKAPFWGAQSRGLGTASLLQSLGSKNDALLTTIQCRAKVTTVSAAHKIDCCYTFIRFSIPQHYCTQTKLHHFTGK